MFQEITSFIGYKMGGISEKYLDKASLNKGYWRVTTYDNYAFHMGNTLEDWMKSESDVVHEKESVNCGFAKNKNVNRIEYFIKNRLFVKFISIKWMLKLFLKWKNLPKGLIEKY